MHPCAGYLSPHLSTAAEFPTTREPTSNSRCRVSWPAGHLAIDDCQKLNNMTDTPTPTPLLDDSKPTPFEAMKNAFYAKYVSSVSLSLIGMWVRVTAMGYLVYDITNDPFLLGLIGVVQGAPQLVFGPLAGAYLDRWDRRKVLMGVQIVMLTMMTLLTWLVWSERVTFGWLVVISVVVGASASFDWPARLSIIPMLVSRRELPSAVAINSAAFNGARVIGPAMAGWMIALVGMAGSFLLAGAATIPFLILLLGMAASVPTAPPKRTGPVEPPFQTLMDGYKYIWNTVEIRTMIGIDLFPIIIGMSYLSMTPAIARDVLGQGPEGLGWLMTFAGLGSLVGTLVVTRINSWPNRGRIVLMAVMFFAVMIMFYGLSGNYYLSLLAIMLVGLGYGTSSTLNDTLIQMNVDEAFRGRVMAAYSTIWGLSPAGGMLAGWMANIVGLQLAIALNGLLVLLYAVYLWFFTPMRKID